MKTLVGLATVAIFATAAADDCVMTQRTVTQQKFTISERGQIRSDVIRDSDGTSRCLVSFKVRIGDQWHQAHGENRWDSQRPSTEACAAAVVAAERDVVSRLQRQSVQSENILTCQENPDAQRLRTMNPGTVGNNEQFRLHPDYPGYFYHNGTRCRHFLENAFNGRDVRAYSGVICELEGQKWVVVDRF